MMIKKIFCLIVLFVSLTNLSGFGQVIKDPKAIEKVISQVIDRAFASSVRISVYDTVKKQTNSAAFSGVSVSAEGHILSVAHTVKPNQHYMVTFPNGSRYEAIGLGRIAIKNDSLALDLAMIKILEKGNWNFVNLAESPNMKESELCIGISHPESFAKMLPNIRLGRLTNVNFMGGFFESTCKMEPGDSGGPLFNCDGKLIGLHSFIRVSEEVNLEVPVYFYRKYWKALNVAKDYKELPAADPLLNVERLRQTVTIPAVQQLIVVSPKQAENSIVIGSVIDGRSCSIMGTIIKFERGSKLNTYIISKSSMVGAKPVIKVGTVTHLARVIGRVEDNDLVLMEVPKIQLNGLVLNDRNATSVAASNPGTLLVSALGGKRQYVSVLSDGLMNMPRGPGFFGANARFIDKKITITQIYSGSAADGTLKLNDQVKGINGIPINQPYQYGEQVSKYFNGDSIAVEIVREGKEMQVGMRLKPYSSSHSAYHFAGGRSLRSDGFKSVFVHDAAILPEECGSPVFSSDNRFYGINIARHSRTSAIIMPVSVINEFLKKITNI